MSAGPVHEAPAHDLAPLVHEQRHDVKPDNMSAWRDAVSKDRGVRRAARVLREIFHGLPWRYLWGRRQGRRRWPSMRLAIAFTGLAIRLPPPPPPEFWTGQEDKP